MNGFLDKHNFVNYLPFLHEATLVGGDDFGEEFL
jgi:hypothetical protein